MNFLRKTVSALAAAATIAALAGCQSSFMPMGSEITAYEIVRVLGIDKGGGDNIEVTLIAERAKPSPGEEGGGVSYETMSDEGPTAFEAVARLRSETDKKQVFGYVDYILFGENTAAEDFAKYADFPARSPEIRYSPKVFMVRGGTAKELIETTSSGDKYIGDSLDNLSKNVNERSDFSLVKNIELMNMLDKRDLAAVLPAIEAKTPEDHGLVDGELPEKELSAAGYAVLRDFKLAGYFDAPDARAYNLLTGGVRTCAYSVKDDSGASTGLDVINSGLVVKPRWNGDMLQGVTITSRVDANIAERQSLADMNSQATQEGLVRQLENAIETELRSVVDKSKEFGIDCFRLGERIKMNNPYRWRKLEGNWREVYKNLEIDVEAEAAVRRVYDIREPGGSNRWRY